MSTLKNCSLFEEFHLRNKLAKILIMMKKSIYIASMFLLVTGMFSCNVFEVDSPKYAKSTTYFANQTPYRTLILGDNDPYDNTKDNNLQFSIGVSIGGLSDNDKDQKVEYIVDESLTHNLYTSTGDTLVALPQAYYTLSPAKTLVIPKGKMEGFIEVQLKESFLSDPKALKKHYVIPLRLISSDTDSILQGKAKVSNADLRIANDWIVVPQNYTLFGIKYVNKYHGKYFYLGKSQIKNQSGVVLDEAVYRQPGIKNNPFSILSTTGNNSVSLAVPVHLSVGSPANVNLQLGINGNEVVVNENDGETVDVNGTGNYKEGVVISGEKYKMIALDYTFSYKYFVEPTITKINNADSKVIYSGTWNHNAEAGNYNGDRSYSNTPGDFLKLDFFGYRIAVYTKTSTTYGHYDVYIDNELVAENVNTSIVFNGGYQCKTFEIAGLSNTKHILKCVIKTAGKWCIFDYFESESGGILPNGTYNWNVKDTLVMYNRAVELESFIPVVK
jgi:hypothetical protein